MALVGGCFENLYTLGMRGIHDSHMIGPRTDAERIETLERIFADQRRLFAEHVRPEVGQVPQVFCVYKEVLDLYRQGLHVPDDVTIVWPDDNFGYIRNFAPHDARARLGASVSTTTFPILAGRSPTCGSARHRLRSSGKR